MGEVKEAVFRSADMVLVEMYIPQEVARDAVYTLGECGLVQLIDLNKKAQNFQRAFVSEVRRLDNVERQYRYFHSLLEKYNVPIYIGKEEEVTEFLYDVPTALSSFTLPPSTSAIDDHIANATILEERFTEMVEASEKLLAQKASLEEFRYLLITAENIFTYHEGPASDTVINNVSLDELDNERLEMGSIAASLSFFSGLILREKVVTLERILWRMLRGNLYFRSIELPEPIYDYRTKEMVEKSVFIVFAHGDIITERSKKVAESLEANLYDIKETADLRSQQLSEVNDQLNDIYRVLEKTELTLEAGLHSLGKELNEWSRQIYKEKLVYQILNQFSYDSSRKTLIAEGWVPSDQVDALQIELQKLTATLGTEAPSIINILKTKRCPPTYHRTNKFTKAFQTLCDSYGVPSYQEVNPGLATIVTFPFMFAIMFGDIGHGIILSLVALTLVLYENSINKMKRNEIFDMVFSGRYILLLMGFFSIYTGLLYNDMFSKSLTLFKSGWKWPDSWELGEMIEAKQVGVYPIGIDSAWHGTENALLFSNSLKMKLSIILGFIHMLYSYSFSLVNALYFNEISEIFCNFIPGLLFLCSIFGYLVICIIYKWSVDWIKDERQAPALLTTLMDMFLAPGNVKEQLYPGQVKVQVFLLILALICVLWLLLAKPLYFKYTHSTHAHQPLPVSEYDMIDIAMDEASNAVPDDDDDDDDGPRNSHGDNMGDVVIHQTIHTIEWCLNCISHTASYLRLWALSLAHAQLSTVLWTMTIQLAFGKTGTFGPLIAVALFAMWFVLTVIILVVMEGTSAMLHSLRLHWIESMSKFFRGEGVAYEPFTFQFESIDQHIESSS